MTYTLTINAKDSDFTNYSLFAANGTCYKKKIERSRIQEDEEIEKEREREGEEKERKREREREMGRERLSRVTELRI